jgi:pyruvate kinase
MAEAGARVFRYNLAARLGLDKHTERLVEFRQARAKAPHKMQLMLDLPIPGAKYRVGMLPEPAHLIVAGTVLRFHTGVETHDIGNHIPVQASHLGTMVVPDQVITVGDGELVLRVLEINDAVSFTALALTTAHLACQKSLNMGSIAVANLAEHAELLDFVAEFKPDFVALSFVEAVDAAAQVFESLAGRGLQRNAYSAIAKIETKAGVAHCRILAAMFDVLMVARGDLALDFDFAYLGEAQEYIINQAKAAGKQCMVATNVCESASAMGIVNRAELVGMYDLAKRNVDFILLAKETSSLPNPVRSVRVLSDVIAAASRPMFL